ncbi:MAG: hypothetical protein NC389_17840 [Acetatifactor muris]|nr:hypothetical protein [Acetatifactor muris]
MRIRTGIRRTTTQMLNNSRRRAGLTTRRGSLLNSSKVSSTGIASRLGAMNAASMQSVKTARAGYERLQKSASSLVDQMALLGEKADAMTEEGKEIDISSNAASMVEDFNAALKYLQQCSGVLNDYYRQSMREAAAVNKADLSEIGITVSADGSLSLDKTKFAEADKEKVKKLLGTAGDFTKQIRAVASRVADNAKVNVETASNQYDSAGGIANSYLSRFNLRG